MKLTRTASRMLALLLTLTMVFGLAASAYAADDAVSAELVIAIDDGPSLSAKIAFSAEESALAIGAGMALSSVNLNAYLSTQSLIIESGLLQEAYGLDLENLAENLENSIFAPDSGSSYALDEDTYNQILSIASGDAFSEEASISDRISEEDMDKLEDAITSLLPALIEAGLNAADEMTAASTEGTITINGESVAVSQTQVTMGNEALIALFDSLLTSLESDTEVQSATAELVNIMAVYDEEITVTGEESVQYILDNMDEVRQSMEEGLSETSVAITVVVSLDEDEQLVQASVDVDADGETIGVDVSISPEQDFFRLELEEDGSVVAIQYAVTEDTEDTFGFRIGMYSDETEAIALTLLLDKAAQTFEAGYISAEDEMEIDVSGYYESSDNLFSLVMDKVNGEEFGGTVTLNLRSSDTLTIPEFTEITSLSESELSSLIAVLSTGVTLLNQALS